MPCSSITLVGRAHSIDITSDPVRLKIAIRRIQTLATTDYRLQASRPEVLEQLQHVSDGQLIGVICTLPAAVGPSETFPVLTLTRLEILGEATPQQEVAQ
jgi:hypothetical protein